MESINTDSDFLFPIIEPVASTSTLSPCTPPSTPPRRLSQGHPVSPRGASVPQETLAVRRFKAAARLSPTLGSRPRARSAEDLPAEGEGAAETGLGLGTQQSGGAPISIRPSAYDSAIRNDTPHTAPPAASSAAAASSPFGDFKFPPAAPPSLPPSSFAATFSPILAPESPLRAEGLSLAYSSLGDSPSAHPPPEEAEPKPSRVPGLLLRASSEDVVRGYPSTSLPVEQEEQSAAVKAPTDSVVVAGPLKSSTLGNKQRPLPSPPSGTVRSPSHLAHKPALPSPLSTSHTSASADGLGPAMRRTEEFPFPSSPSTPSFPLSNDTPRARSPPTPVNAAASLPPAADPSPPPPAIPRHLQHSSPPPASQRTRSQSGEFQVSPPRASASHWRSSSSVSSSPRYASHEPAPLTPPESAGTGRHLTSASDLAWNDVLGPIGALSFAGIDYSHGDSREGSGKSSIMAQVDDLMALEGDTPLPTRALPLGGTSHAATPEGSQERMMGNAALMLGSGGGHFGSATRERLASLIDRHLPEVPLDRDDVVHIVEYGALNSRSASLVPPVISHLASRHAQLLAQDSSAADDAEQSISFQVTHADKVNSDFRALAQMLDTSSESYLNSSWLAAHDPQLEGRVFSAFASRPFASKVLPRASVSFGFSAMALHWLSTDRKYQMPPANLAHGELMAFLSSRATEFKPGGLLAIAYIARSEAPTPVAHANLAHTLHRGASIGSSSTPSTPGETVGAAARPTLKERAISSPVVPLVKKRDIWDVLSGILGKAIQRLVSTNLLKPAVARLLLTLPIHPRTPRQTHAALRAMQHSWTVEEEEMLVLAHPAWRGLEHKTVSEASYSDHTIQLLRIFYESTIRLVLKEALESRAACEWILECIWTVAKEKVDEEGPSPLELEVQIIALRRKGPEGV